MHCFASNQFSKAISMHSSLFRRDEKVRKQFDLHKEFPSMGLSLNYEDAVHATAIACYVFSFSCIGTKMRFSSLSHCTTIARRTDPFSSLEMAYKFREFNAAIFHEIVNLFLMVRRKTRDKFTGK